jgi:hypothetical protein
MRAGIRGIVVGAILLSIGVIVGAAKDLQVQMIGWNVGSNLIIGSAVLILIAGVINYIYREI